MIGPVGCGLPAASASEGPTGRDYRHDREKIGRGGRTGGGWILRNQWLNIMEELELSVFGLSDATRHANVGMVVVLG